MTMGALQQQSTGKLAVFGNVIHSGSKNRVDCAGNGMDAGGKAVFRESRGEHGVLRFSRDCLFGEANKRCSTGLGSGLWQCWR